MFPEMLPTIQCRALTAQRESRNRIEACRLEQGIDTERLGQPDGIVGRGAADMDVLAEDGELFGQIAVALI